MHWLDLTLSSPAENLALDEALLLEAEAERGGEVLRVWEPERFFVVLGRSSRKAEEVDVEACRRLKIDVYRRSSGGAAVVAGPGCLMYALVLAVEGLPGALHVPSIHCHVLSRIAAAIRPMCPGVAAEGISDLALGGRKFSGNSLRCLRGHVLYHGTLLYDFPLERIGQCLRSPPRQPAYRQGRPHRDFLTNLPLGREQLRAALQAAWEAYRPLAEWPAQLMGRLAREKYSTPQWNEKR